MSLRAVRRSATAGAVAAALAVGAVAAAPLGDSGVRTYVDRVITGLEQGYYANTPEWDAALARALPELRAAEQPSDVHRSVAELTKAAGGEHSHFDSP